MKLIKMGVGITLLTTVANAYLITPSLAQEIEEDTNIYLEKISCRELLKMPGEDKKLTLIFYHGLMSAKKDQMVVDRITLRDATDQVIDYCINNPDETLMTVFDQYR